MSRDYIMNPCDGYSRIDWQRKGGRDTMDNPCGMTKANVFEKTEVNGIPVYYGAGVNPVNSPAQFFVAWGKGVLSGGLIHTFNSTSAEQGFLWFVDEDEAEDHYLKMQRILVGNLVRTNICARERRY